MSDSNLAPRRPTHQVMHLLELRIPPVLTMVLFGALMAALAHAVPTPLFLPGRFFISVFMLVAGVIVSLAGVASFRRHKTTVNPMRPELSSELVTTGVYRFSRNPMYLGFALILAGWGVFLASWAALLLLPIFMVYMNLFQIGPEEKFLRKRFGESFIDYSERVQRWL